MRRLDLETLTEEQLVERFAAIGVAQDDALWDYDKKKYARLFAQMQDIKKHLDQRFGDQRALLALYSHPNVQVRLMAAKATLAAAPEQARSAIEAIAESHLYPQAGDAGMCLLMLDSKLTSPD